MPSKESARGSLYLAYSAGPSMLSAVTDALALMRGNHAATPSERVTVGRRKFGAGPGEGG